VITRWPAICLLFTSKFAYSSRMEKASLACLDASLAHQKTRHLLTLLTLPNLHVLNEYVMLMYLNGFLYSKQYRCTFPLMMSSYQYNSLVWYFAWLLIVRWTSIPSDYYIEMGQIIFRYSDIHLLHTLLHICSLKSLFEYFLLYQTMFLVSKKVI